MALSYPDAGGQILPALCQTRGRQLPDIPFRLCACGRQTFPSRIGEGLPAFAQNSEDLILPIAQGRRGAIFRFRFKGN